MELVEYSGEVPSMMALCELVESLGEVSSVLAVLESAVSLGEVSSVLAVLVVGCVSGRGAVGVGGIGVG